MKPPSAESASKQKSPARPAKSGRRTAVPRPSPSSASLRALLEMIPSGRLSKREARRRAAELEPHDIRIDLGLAISGATLAPGRCRSAIEIADYCGCSFQTIYAIEQRALAKMRNIIEPMIELGEIEWP